MSLVINLPFGLSDIDKVFVVIDFLENKDSLLKEFKPEVSKFLVKEGFFQGPFKKSYEENFDNLVVSLIRRQLVSHFPSFTPEEIVLLTDPDFLKMITDEFYFNKENYLKERDENDESTNPLQ